MVYMVGIVILGAAIVYSAMLLCKVGAEADRAIERILREQEDKG